MENLLQNNIRCLFKKALLLLVCLNVLACKDEEKKVEVIEEENKVVESDFKFGTWITADVNKTNDAYSEEFKKYSDAGIDHVLINTGTDPQLLERIVPAAVDNGLKVHAWIMAMNRPGDSLALQHPDWYIVSREGKSCHDTRPYVDYYQWLCPTREASRNHVLGLVEGLAKVEGIESVHLDYIRFPDIFLPIGLLPKYDLVQNEELAEFDFCYCDVCVAEYEKIHHKNPRNMENVALDIEWKNFRLNKIRAVVNDAYEIAQKHNKKLTAAVFPYPEMADHMVRQRWDKWNIDEVYPMIYHGFYNEEIDWVGYATRQGVEDLSAKEVKLNTGLYIPDFKTPQELHEGIMQAKNNGAVGVSFFDGGAITPEFLEQIKKTKASL